MTLFESEKGCTYLVKDIELKDETKQRLHVLGLTVGTSVDVINRKKSGTMIIKIRGTRFAIGSKIAKGIKTGGVV